MRLGWGAEELQLLCQSREGLVRKWPQHAKDAQMLLHMLANAASLFDVRKLQCLDVEVHDPVEPGHALGLDVQHIKVRLEGALVNRQGTPILIHPAGTSVEWMKQIDCVRVGALTIVRNVMKATG